ncbi:hypothetical protein AAZV13_03G071000 [Glycine max]
MAARKEEKKEDIEVITAIYKVNLHCKECGSKIKKHLTITQGVLSVEIEFEKGEINAKGKIEPLKILKLIEKKSKEKVELISPEVKPKEITSTEIKPKEIKDPIIRIISVRVHMHCGKCEADLKSRLIKHKGIFNVKTDQKAQNVTVEGTIEVEKLISFLRKRVHKNAEIISIKEVKRDQEKKGKEEVQSSETSKEKDHSKSEENKIKDNVPYIIHYVYAQQLFTGENPNSCSIL